VGLAWLLHRDPRILLIPGTASLAHPEDNVAVSHVHLDPETAAALDSLA
jgi:pyridoxine 4-dehydrogenase